MLGCILEKTATSRSIPRRSGPSSTRRDRRAARPHRRRRRRRRGTGRRQRHREGPARESPRRDQALHPEVAAGKRKPKRKRKRKPARLQKCAIPEPCSREHSSDLRMGCGHDRSLTLTLRLTNATRLRADLDPDQHAELLVVERQLAERRNRQRELDRVETSRTWYARGRSRSRADTARRTGRSSTSARRNVEHSVEAPACATCAG